MVSYKSLIVVGWCSVVAVTLSLFGSLTLLGFFQEGRFQKKGLLYRKRRICAVVQEQAGEWSLHLADGSVQLCLLSGASVVSRFVIFLSFKPIGRGKLFAPLLTRPLLIATDSVSTQTYRRLHVWLRWQSGELLGLTGLGDRDKNNRC
ncbi:hypothetical protein A9Q81_15145 [Gammaproteobacteria bacterium 42_54_T18]|nr:hypothetical protein A9Q81_15145 [Gammaproteobacteria bacterium 42_54_T18]